MAVTTRGTPKGGKARCFPMRALRETVKGARDGKEMGQKEISTEKQRGEHKKGPTDRKMAERVAWSQKIERRRCQPSRGKKGLCVAREGKVVQETYRLKGPSLSRRGRVR